MFIDSYEREGKEKQNYLEENEEKQKNIAIFSFCFVFPFFFYTQLTLLIRRQEQRKDWKRISVTFFCLFFCFFLAHTHILSHSLSLDRSYVYIDLPVRENTVSSFSMVQPVDYRAQH
jgi:hypothetical protein